jgi:hypothetical protein
MSSIRESPVEVDPTRVCELLVGLPDVNVLGAIDDPGGALRVVIETREPRPACAGCAGAAQIKDRPVVERVDLAAFRQAGPPRVAQASVGVRE